MPKRNYGFEKRQKELDKRRKQDEKRQRKRDRANQAPGGSQADDVAATDEPSESRAELE